MGEFKDPFAEDLRVPKHDQKESTPVQPEFDVSGLIRRLAEIDDELTSRELKKLEKEKDELKKKLKDYMLKYEQEMAYDETSGWEAVLVPRSSDSWNMNALKGFLKTKQWNRYTTVGIDLGAIDAGIKAGDLKRPELERVGAVVRNPGSKALYVRERKTDEEVD